MSAFEEYGVMPEIIKALEEVGWELPRDIQAECIPLILGGGDVMAAAETGSGKTGAFGLPLLQVVYETLRDLESPKKSSKSGEQEKAVLNPDDKDGVLLVSQDGYLAQNNTQQWAGVRANLGVMKGKYYYEVTVSDGNLVRVGWSSRASKLELGKDKTGFGFGATAKKSNDNDFKDYGEIYGKGDTVGCLIDLDEFTISFSKNGKEFGVAFTIPNNLQRFSFYPAICIKQAEVKVNFGASPFKHLPPLYKGIEQADRTEAATAQNAPRKGKNRLPLALILEPTRELAQQISEEIGRFMKYLPAPRVEQVLLVGGVPPGPQQQALANGVDIVSGTTGRTIDILSYDFSEFCPLRQSGNCGPVVRYLPATEVTRVRFPAVAHSFLFFSFILFLQLIQSGVLDISNVRFFVLDEADALIKQDASVIMKIWERIPKNKNLQVLFFSATLHSPDVREVSEKLCKFPTWVDLKGKDSVPETVDHTFVQANPKLNNTYLTVQPRIETDGIHYRDQINLKDLPNDDSLSEAIKLLKPILLKRIIDSFKMDQAMIFCRTRLDCDNLEAYFKGVTGRKGPLVDTEYSCAVLHSGKSQGERQQALQSFKDVEVRFLISTDAAARGIDIKELPYVINYTLPDLPEDYIHRIGRVGRAERMGLAISIVGSAPEKVWFHTCPSKGKNCNNSRLRDDGGCAIWYNEPEYWRVCNVVQKVIFQVIQERLAKKIEPLDQNFKLPASLQSTVTYGQKKEGGEDAVFKGHAEQLKPIVEELAELEDAAQKSFWNLKYKFQPTKKK